MALSTRVITSSEAVPAEQRDRGPLGTSLEQSGKECAAARTWKAPVTDTVPLGARGVGSTITPRTTEPT
jgi:hypothetical protein